MQITGKIHEVGATQQVTESFKKRDLVLIVAENQEYPDYIKVEFTQDKVNVLDKFKVGDAVTVGFNLRGRAFTKTDGNVNYYISLLGWKIDKGSSEKELVGYKSNDDQEDGLPF